MPGHRKRRQFKQTDAFTRGMVIGPKRAVIVAVYACGVDVEKGPIRQQLWNAPPCDNVESWFGAQSRMIPDNSQEPLQTTLQQVEELFENLNTNTILEPLYRDYYRKEIAVVFPSNREDILEDLSLEQRSVLKLFLDKAIVGEKSDLDGTLSDFRTELAAWACLATTDVQASRSHNRLLRNSLRNKVSSAEKDRQAAAYLGLSGGYESVVKNIDTSFSCEGRAEGYYADVNNDCKIFHRCVPIRSYNGIDVAYIKRYSFFCPLSTQFDQRYQSQGHQLQDLDLLPQNQGHLHQSLNLPPQNQGLQLQDLNLPLRNQGHQLQDLDLLPQNQGHLHQSLNLPPQNQGHLLQGLNLPPQNQGHQLQDLNLPPQNQGHLHQSLNLPPQNQGHLLQGLNLPPQNQGHQLQDLNPPPQNQGHLLQGLSHQMNGLDLLPWPTGKPWITLKPKPPVPTLKPIPSIVDPVNPEVISSPQPPSPSSKPWPTRKPWPTLKPWPTHKPRPTWITLKPKPVDPYTVEPPTVDPEIIYPPGPQPPNPTYPGLPESLKETISKLLEQEIAKIQNKIKMKVFPNWVNKWSHKLPHGHRPRLPPYYLPEGIVEEGGSGEEDSDLDYWYGSENHPENVPVPGPDGLPALEHENYPDHSSDSMNLPVSSLEDLSVLSPESHSISVPTGYPELQHPESAPVLENHPAPSHEDYPVLSSEELPESQPHPESSPEVPSDYSQEHST
ncbi:hypothetical protein LAZ67_8000402 [Cordylochernes scorpioides]|uniref:Uncharacterized protein n=1 Tax=Cordylochernes scorpioides TaxID=51811 RepID=A0ABY6KQ85_9ARAC|nr:hypothetical protein LAZ67_8000402 [Cordylochernes scorpioides]